MIRFECQKCGEVREENVLPGKHAVLGTIRSIQNTSDCCESPQYFDSRGFKEKMVHTDLGSMVSKA